MRLKIKNSFFRRKSRVSYHTKTNRRKKHLKQESTQKQKITPAPQKKKIPSLHVKKQKTKEKETELVKKKEVKKVVKKESLTKNKAVAKLEKSTIQEQKQIVQTQKDFFEQEQIALEKYMQYVYKTVNAHKFYPKMAKRMGVEGKCKISFKILSTGEIENVHLVEKSSFSALNKAALQIIQKIGKFEAFPKSISKKMITLEIPLQYQLKGP